MSEALKGIGNLGASLRRAMEKQSSEISTGMPGRIESYDPSGPKCDVTPVLFSFIEDPMTYRIEPEEFATIPNCPVEWPVSVSSGVGLTLELNAGDFVWIKFSERSMDSWLAGKPTEKDPRRFDKNDAVVQAGVYPFGQWTAPNDGAWFGQVSGANKVRFQVNGSGKLHAGDDITNLVSALVEFFEDIVAGALTTPSGAVTFTPGPHADKYTALIAALNSLKP